jgi:hypothetical protein
MYTPFPAFAVIFSRYDIIGQASASPGWAMFLVALSALLRARELVTWELLHHFQEVWLASSSL